MLYHMQKPHWQTATEKNNVGTNRRQKQRVSGALWHCIQTEEKQGSQKWIVIWEGHNTGAD